MNIRGAVLDLTDGAGRRWRVEVAAGSGGAAGNGAGVIPVEARPGVRVPEPVEIAPGAWLQPASEPDGTWALLLDNVAEVRMYRVEGGFPAVSAPLPGEQGPVGVPGTPPGPEEAQSGAEGAEGDPVVRARRRALGDAVEEDPTSPVAAAARVGFRLGWEAALGWLRNRP